MKSKVVVKGLQILERRNTIWNVVIQASVFRQRQGETDHPVGNDPNAGDNLSYEWEQIDQNQALSLNGENSETLVLTDLPTSLESNPTEYMFELTVVDQGLQVSEPDTVKISLGEFAPPASPNLYAVPYSDYIKLSWDFVSEASIDPLTKYADFEG